MVQINQKTLAIALETGDLNKIIEIFAAHGKTKLYNNEIDAGCYYLTNAYIYALESGSDRVWEFHKILKSYGREE